MPPPPDPAKLIAEAREKSRNAACAPWTAHEDEPHWEVRAEHSLGFVAEVQDREEAEFIAFARTAVPALADALEAALKENERLRNENAGLVAAEEAAHEEVHLLLAERRDPDA